MDKIMKTFIALLLIQFNLSAQSWQEVNINYNARSMAINPYDSTIWFVKKYPAHMDQNGVLIEYNTSLVPIFNFVDFTCSKPVFTSNATYAYTNGANFFYKFNGTTFEKIYLPGNQTMFFNMSAFDDTLYLNCSNPTQTLMYYQDQLVGQSAIESFRLRKGQSTFYSSYNIATVNLNFSQNQFQYFYNCPNNHQINDLNVKPGTDTLYFTSIDKIYTASLSSIVDSITPFNSTQMPLGHLITFRFDLGDNIWTLFGDSNCNLVNHYTKQISNYNVATQTWDQTINVSALLTPYPELNPNMIAGQIEIDPYNNVWLLLYINNITKYFLMPQGDVPSWVGVNETPGLFHVSCYPNPTNQFLNIELPNTTNENIQIFDVTGKLVREFKNNNLAFQTEISLFDDGIYTIRFSINGKELTKRFIVQK